MIARKDSAGGTLWNDTTGDQQANQIDEHEDIKFDGQWYHYRQLSFTMDEAGVLPDCPLSRVKAMVDATYNDPVRQREIARFGKRPWHSRVRPESAVCQALDYALGHDVSLAARYIPYIGPFFEGDPSRADTWTMDLRRAYAQRKIDPGLARRLLEQAGVLSFGGILACLRVQPAAGEGKAASPAIECE